MKCTEFEKLVNEYVDGELNHSLIDIEEHIKSCDTCKALYEETQALKNLLVDLDEIELPDDFEATLHEKLVAASEEKKVIPFYKRSKGLKVFASFAAVAVISIFAFKAGTLVPQNNGMFNDANNSVVAMESNYVEDDMEMAMDMPSEEMADADMASEPGLTAFATSEAAMNKSLRMEMDNKIYAEESVNYWLDRYTDIVKLQEFINRYKLTDFHVVTERRFTFYIPNVDYPLFAKNLNDAFDITNELVLEFSTGHEEIQDFHKEQSKLVESLAEELESEETESLRERFETETRVLENLQNELNNIEYYRGLKQITININEE